jgi:small subunit ribosomal protein S20
MANTRQSAKRARQEKRRNIRNKKVQSETKTAVNAAIAALKTKDVEKTKTAYKNAIRALSKAASKGSIPTGRASRKTSRLTLLIKKEMPQALVTKA